MVWLGNRLRLAGASAWLLVTGAAAGALMLAATITWHRHGDQEISPVSSQAAFISSWNPQVLPTEFQWRRPYRASPKQLMRRIEVPMRAAAVTERPRASDLAAGPRLGAADYSIVLESAQPPQGELEARIGDTTLPLERWRLDGLTGKTLALPLRLPVPVTALRLYADDAALASIEKGSLHLDAVRAPAAGGTAPAWRAVRFGDLRMFFLDDMAYPEPAGFWTRGAAATTVLIDRRANTRLDAVTVALQSGPVATTVDLSIAGRRQRVALGARERREVRLALGEGDAPRALSIRTGATFRPVQHDSRAVDFRPLGVWVELR